MEKQEYMEKFSDYVVDMEEEEIEKLAIDYIEEGYDAFDAIMEGLIPGMDRVSVLFEEEEYFVTDLLLCSDSMYAALNVLKPHIKEEKLTKKTKGVIGVIQGDTHDIGKNLVKIMMEAGGFEMVDLGRDVPVEEFVNAVVNDEDIEFVCLSTLMTTTMPGMKAVIEGLEEKGVRDRVKVMIGGGPISRKFAEQIGADLYTVNAVEAVKGIKELLSGK
ncbi:corrinoid protein [Citroniella saccharovorans]|uniref:Corrinoid protein n=1 Tax=Citroniella saccharovorans TaxID=2053367 RepID=A0AAW9MN27_9FIRM|nr:corrinoid protein [Citroniella saccharovorans]MEB3428948.1 corrinoid protein [Citroniella saccharovorans]